jgi:hypothetical protein
MVTRVFIQKKGNGKLEPENQDFVIHGSIRGIRHYWGDPSVTLDEATIQSAIRTLEESGKANSAYGIDFGGIGKRRDRIDRGE